MPLLLPQIAAANDCSVGTDGGYVFIKVDRDSSMSREEIHIRMLRDSAVVTCKRWFYNREKEKRETIGEIKRVEDRNEAAPRRGWPLRGPRLYI